MYWRQQFEEVPAFSLVVSLGPEDSNRIHIVRKSPLPQNFTDSPGVAVINPGHFSQEIIAFEGVDFVDYNYSMTLKGVARGIDGGPFAHPVASDIYIDQGEQYVQLIEDTAKVQLKRWLKTLL